MTRKTILIILGSGLYDLYAKDATSQFSVETPFGVSEVSELQRFFQCKVYLMMRHGQKRSIPPHLINYRANIAAAKELKADYIIATSSVGSLSPKIPVQSYVVVNQFLDFTKSRASSIFYERAENFAHTDMTNPYSREIRKALIRALQRSRAKFSPRGTYICTEGPRFETPAEIKMYRKLGADVVGMTGVPEVVIANELKIPYGNLSLVTNMAAGMQSKVTQAEVVSEMKKSLDTTRSIIELALGALVEN
ncbi:MAG: MTAP family purine nucleoside phosphorylase [Nitrososphaerales archaeon]